VSKRGVFCVFEYNYLTETKLLKSKFIRWYVFINRLNTLKLLLYRNNSCLFLVIFCFWGLFLMC